MAAPAIGPPAVSASPSHSEAKIGIYKAPDGSTYQVTYSRGLPVGAAKKAELIRQAGMLIEHLKAKGKDANHLKVTKDSIEVDKGAYALDEEISQEALKKYNAANGLYEIQPKTTLRVAALAISQIFHTNRPEEEERLRRLREGRVQIEAAPSTRGDLEAIELSTHYVSRTASSRSRTSP